MRDIRPARGAEVLNLGVNGARTADVLDVLAGTRAQSAVRGADVVVLSIGGNDLYGSPRAHALSRAVPWLQQRRTLANVGKVVAAIRALSPSARVYVLGLYNPYRRTPLRAWLDRQVNLWDARLIGRFAEEPRVTVVRIHDILDDDSRISTLDRFHPGAAGYAAIAERITSTIRWE